MKLYTLFRWNRPAYNFIYKLYQYNHENKFLHQKVVLWLKWIDKLLIIIPVIFALRKTYPNNKFLKDLIEATLLKPMYLMFDQNPILFSSLCLFLFVFAVLYRNTYRIYQNEEIVSKGFHTANHLHRNFVNEIITYKKDQQIFRKSLIDHRHCHALKQKYHAFVGLLCNEAQRQLAKIVNDSDCYIVLKLLVEKDAGHYTLRHHGAYPDVTPDRHLNNLELNKESVNNPRNLFQVIINRFNAIEDGIQTWGLGIFCNDLKGHPHFDPHLINGDFSRYRASIIIPITIDYGLVGFFCFNTKRIGMLRRKHRHFLAGYCDGVANAFRNIM